MSSTLLVNKDRLIQLLDHRDKRVRNQCAKTLGSFFPKSTGMITPIIQAINKNKNDSLALVASIKNFIPSNEEFAELVKLFNETDQNQDEHSMNISWHIQQSLLDFPIELLMDNRNIIKFNKNLTQCYDIAVDRERIKSQKPDDLWDSLREICKRYKDKNMDGESSQYGMLFKQGLLRHKEDIKHKVVMYLSGETTVDYHLEDYLVQLSGDLKIEESVPYLFKLLISTDFMHTVHDKSISALGKIGGSRVIDYIDNNWSNEELRPEYAGILGCIPFDYSEDLLIRCLNKETDKTVKTYLSCALCDIFSMKGIEPVLNVIGKREYDPQIMSLPDHLIPIYIYHGITIDDTENIESEQDQFIKATREKDPLYQVAKKCKNSFDRILSEQKKKESTKENIPLRDDNNPIPLLNSLNHDAANKIPGKNKTGRNAPCPCGSGKKYKKCCLKKEHA